MTINGKTRLLGVMGHPVSHSLSPSLHNGWLSRLNINACYVPLPVAPYDFQAALKILPLIGFQGVNVTAPHKEQAFCLADCLDSSAQAAGAVNTMVLRNGKWHGFNTDGYGFWEGLKTFSPLPLIKEKPVLVIGAGGAGGV
ncbi:hypothetical protein HC891_19890 [Candidatus Gracilibacteria bacterium]|nr:hypothetical protein [Candidatus Gracilibacteria bacterium]